MTEATQLVSGPLQTERLHNGRRRVLRVLAVECDGSIIEVPSGTNTDLTSIPFFACPFIKWSRVDVAGVVHDHLYQQGIGSRRQADRIWRKLAASGAHRANPMQAWSGWLLLRLTGWAAWYRYRWFGNPHT